MGAVIIVGLERIGVVGRIVVILVINAEVLLTVSSVCIEAREWHTLGRNPHCFGRTLW